jgi:hypothetical protein
MRGLQSESVQMCGGMYKSAGGFVMVIGPGYCCDTIPWSSALPIQAALSWYPSLSLDSEASAVNFGSLIYSFSSFLIAIVISHTRIPRWCAPMRSNLSLNNRLLGFIQFLNPKGRWGSKLRGHRQVSPAYVYSITEVYQQLCKSDPLSIVSVDPP